ncbi:MAG: acyl-CoA carboxylase subunit beta [Planctomycetes bacterium]|nr:acyl-CoA carboxylase subunit beta [Planctomycetota bacterium]
MNVPDSVDRLHEKREAARRMGPPERIEAQLARGKMTVRERVDRLFDPGSFEEFALLARSEEPDLVASGKETPADGVVTGAGKIDGREVFVAAYDFTVLAGSMGLVGERKVTRVRQMARTHLRPMVWLIDSAGARIQEIASTRAFAGTGNLFYEQVQMSGLVPQVAAVMGPGAAGTAYIPGLADFVIMVKGTSSMALGGPPLVKQIVGEDVTEQELGGSAVHTRESGVADLEIEDDAACLASIRRYLSFFPSHSGEKPPALGATDPADRADEELRSALPANPRMAYDVKRILVRLVDGGDLFEVKPAFARNVVTALARFGGRPAGIVANQPQVLAGALDNDGSDKAARFIQLCDAFNVPLVFFQDIPGFMVGTKVEKEGIIRHGAKLLFAVSEATVPKITVVLRKAYGAGYYVMCGRSFGPDLLVAWPTAEISLMGAGGAVEIIHRKRIEAASDPKAEKERLVREFQEKIGPYEAAESGLVDDVIDPRETRRVICRALERTAAKSISRPAKKHGVTPV